MSNRGKPSNRIGYRNPPRASRFQKGKSGNPAGRPKGSRNFATVMEEELNSRVPVTENGARRKISKRQAIAKQVVNKAVTGDLKAAQTVFNQDRVHEGGPAEADSFAVFDTAEHHLVIADIVRRIRMMTDDAVQIVPDTAQLSLFSNDRKEAK